MLNPNSIKSIFKGFVVANIFGLYHIYVTTTFMELNNKFEEEKMKALRRKNTNPDS